MWGRLTFGRFFSRAGQGNSLVQGLGEHRIAA